MPKFTYEVTILADDQKDADDQMARWVLYDQQPIVMSSHLVRVHPDAPEN